MQGNKSKLQSFFKPPALHPLHERDWSMGKKSGILLELAVLLLLLPSQYSEVSWLLSFSMVMHWPYIYILSVGCGGCVQT
jgi:hypothetical protein